MHVGSSTLRPCPEACKTFVIHLHHAFLSGEGRKVGFILLSLLLATLSESRGGGDLTASLGGALESMRRGSSHSHSPTHN